MTLFEKEILQRYLDNNADSRLFPILTEIYLKEQRVDQAIKVCQNGLRMHPGSACGHYMMARAVHQQGDIDLALQYLKATIALQPSFLQAYYYLLALGRQQLPADELKQIIEKIRFLNPFDPDPASYRSEHAESSDEAPVTIEELQQILKGPAPAEEPHAESEIFTEPEPIAAAPGGDLVGPSLDTILSGLEEQPLQEPAAAAPETVPAAPAWAPLREEEAHFGPLEPPFADEQEESVSFEAADFTPPPPVTVAPPQLIIETAPVAQPSPTRPPSPPMPTIKPPVAPGRAAVSLNDMFKKLKTQPLDQVQQEKWELPVLEPVAAPPPRPAAPEEPPATTGFVIPAVDLRYAPDLTVTPEPVQEAPEKTPRPAKKATPDIKPMDLKIPIPTLTLVEVLKKQKLYDEALKVLDALENKSKDPEKIRSARAEIMQLKAQEEMDI